MLLPAGVGPRTSTFTNVVTSPAGKPWPRPSDSSWAWTTKHYTSTSDTVRISWQTSSNFKIL